MKTFIKVLACIILISFIYIVGYSVGTYDTYRAAHDQFLGKCLKYARGYPATGWCKLYVGDYKERE